MAAAQRPSIQALEGAAPPATAFALSIEYVSDADGNGSAGFQPAPAGILPAGIEAR